MTVQKKNNLNNLLKPMQPLPADDVMIAKALELLELCPHGQQLANFAEKKAMRIKVLATPEPVTYMPQKDLIYIGFNRASPVSPSRFILMLTGVLREAQQEAAGIHHPPLTAPLSQHIDVSMAKYEDKVWYMCTVAKELNSQEIFAEYHFLDELRKMGHNEALELYLKQERDNY